MKTSEFIKAVENMKCTGFEVVETSRCYLVNNQFSRTIASVDKMKDFSLDTAFVQFDTIDYGLKCNLFKILTTYASTPIADREEEKLYKLKFISKTITETHYMAYRFFSGEYKPMTTNSMGLSNGAVGWRYIFTESELETMDTTGFERVEIHE